jgi:hypothetical protein
MPIDMLHCVPPSTVSESYGRRTSELATSFYKNGWEIWDAVDERTRRVFPRSNSAFRIIQHESCRGLEGWTVALDGLDEFWEQKYATAITEVTNRQVTDVADPHLHSLAVAWRWCMIPLTRPIDTLVITLRSKNSPLAKTIKRVASLLPDIVELI